MSPDHPRHDHRNPALLAFVLVLIAVAGIFLPWVTLEPDSSVGTSDHIVPNAHLNYPMSGHSFHLQILGPLLAVAGLAIVAAARISPWREVPVAALTLSVLLLFGALVNVVISTLVPIYLQPSGVAGMGLRPGIGLWMMVDGTAAGVAATALALRRATREQGRKHIAADTFA